MKKLSLTPKEKTTFYGLVRFPDLNDRALSEVLGEKMSTVTSIRRRLRKRGYFVKTKVPDFRYLDFELLCIIHGSFKPVTTHGTEVLSKMRERGPTTFYGVSNPYHFIMMGVSNCYTDARRNYDAYYQNDEFLEVIDEKEIDFNYLPYSMTEVHNFFDFSGLLKTVFDIEEDYVDPEECEPEPPEDLSFTPTEKKVFLGLVRFPETADKNLATKIDVSRQAVSKMRKKFETNGLLRTTVIPKLSKLDLGMIIFSRYTLNPKKAGSPEKDKSFEEESDPCFFSCSTPYESFSLSAFSTYQEYERMSEKYYKLHTEKDILIDNPTMLPFSIDDVRYFKNHRYYPVLKKRLAE